MKYLLISVSIIFALLISGCSTFAITRGLYRSSVPHYEYKAYSVYEANGFYYIVIARSINYSKDMYNITQKSNSDKSIIYDPVSNEISVLVITMI